MLRKAAIQAAFAVIQKFLISKIDFEPLRGFFERLINPAEKVADLLTDSNPNNSEQFKQFWSENRNLLLENSLDTAIAIAKTRIRDESIRNLVVALLESLDANGNLKPDALA